MDTKECYDGMLVEAVLQNPHGGPQRRVVGQVKDMVFSVVSGDGHEYTLRATECNRADVRAQKDYWMERALHAEREGFGKVPGKTVDYEVPA